MPSTCRSYRKIHLILHSEADHFCFSGTRYAGQNSGTVVMQGAGKRSLGKMWSNDFPDIVIIVLNGEVKRLGFLT